MRDDWWLELGAWSLALEVFSIASGRIYPVRCRLSLLDLCGERTLVIRFLSLVSVIISISHFYIDSIVYALIYVVDALYSVYCVGL